MPAASFCIDRVRTGGPDRWKFSPERAALRCVCPQRGWIGSDRKGPCRADDPKAGTGAGRLRDDLIIVSPTAKKTRGHVPPEFAPSTPVLRLERRSGLLGDRKRTGALTSRSGGDGLVGQRGARRVACARAALPPPPPAESKGESDGGREGRETVRRPEPGSGPSDRRARARRAPTRRRFPDRMARTGFRVRTRSGFKGDGSGTDSPEWVDAGGSISTVALMPSLDCNGTCRMAEAVAGTQLF